MTDDKKEKSQEDLQKEENLTLWLKTQKRRHIESIATAVITLGVLGGIGFLLDRQFDTGHVFLIIGCVASFIAMQILLIFRMRKYAKASLQKKKYK